MGEGRSRPGAPEAASRAALGRAAAWWDSLVGRATAAGCAGEWKFYRGATGGWRYVLRSRGRSVVYLRPGEDAFLASFALSEEALAAAQRAGAPADLVRQILESPQLPEGRAARVEVASAAGLKIAAALLDAKLGSGKAPAPRRK